MMTKVPLRLRFLLLLLLGVLAVTATTLLIVRREIELQIHNEIEEDVRDSVLTFRTFQRERDVVLDSDSGGLVSVFDNRRTP